MNEIPKTSFALISGSAGWGIKFPEDLHEPGIRVLEHGLTFDTPWGPSQNWQVIECDGSITPDGKSRLVLNIFAHGWDLEEINHDCHRRAFWVLNEAGALKVIADSTCGSVNRALNPGDYVISNDTLDLGQTRYSVLPGRFKYLCRGAQLFCPAMGKTLETVARELWPANRRVLGMQNQLVSGYILGPRFETPAEARALQLLGADLVSQSMGPEAGNAREIGACYISGSYVTNFVDGILDHWGDLDSVHDQLGAIAARISIRAIARVELVQDCGCQGYRKERPQKYSQIH
jgi:5'-methylthioadenosine phosphorylase